MTNFEFFLLFSNFQLISNCLLCFRFDLGFWFFSLVKVCRFLAVLNLLEKDNYWVRIRSLCKNLFWQQYCLSLLVVFLHFVFRLHHFATSFRVLFGFMYTLWGIKTCWCYARSLSQVERKLKTRKMEVQIISKQNVKPSSPTPSPLRNFKLFLLDQLATAPYAPILLFYPMNKAILMSPKD